MRFKLKTPFMEYARDQVKGGLWYRPTWWDAVGNVPPIHFQPRIKKRDVQNISFLEDKLAKRFQTRNPSIAAFDQGKGLVRKGSFSKIEEGFPTVTRQFIEEQMAAMRSGMPEEAAYAATRGWLLGNGPRLFNHLSVPKAIKKVVTQTPASLGALRLVNEAALAQQVQALRELLAAKEEERGEAGKGRRLGAGVKAGLLGSKEGAVKEAVQRRAMSRDLELPRRPVNAGGGGAAPTPTSR